MEAEDKIKQTIESVLSDKVVNMNFQVAAYVELMDKIKSDIRTNSQLSIVTRLAYDCYYDMPAAKLSQVWKDKYFGILGKYMCASDNIKNDLTLEALMTEVGPERESNQPSFVSKLLHTVRNDEPIYDEKVRTFLQTGDVDGKGVDVRKNSAVEIYERIKSFYTDAKYGELRRGMVSVFNKKYGQIEMTETKRLDFVCWALGKRGKKITEFGGERP